MDSLEKELDLRPRVGLSDLIIREGKVLLGKRKAVIGDAAWAPPGGHLEYGESVEECAMRELKEETGLIAKKIIRGPYTNTLIAPKNQHYVTLFVIITDFEGEVECLEPHKCEGWHWFDIDNLPSPLITSLEFFLQEHDLSKWCLA